MEYFSQNLKNEENLVCVLCRAGRMPRETANAKHVWQNGNLGSSSPTLRLPNPEQWPRDPLPVQNGAQRPLRQCRAEPTLKPGLLFQACGCSNEQREYQNILHRGICHFTVCDMACITPNFGSYFHLKNNYCQNFTQDIVLIASILIYLQSTCCEVFAFCLFLLKYKRAQNRKERAVL